MSEPDDNIYGKGVPLLPSDTAPGAVKRFMDSCPAAAALKPFNNEHHAGAVIKWSEPGVGFGEITISLDRATGAWAVDTETMGPDFVVRMFERLAVRAPLSPEIREALERGIYSLEGGHDIDSYLAEKAAIALRTFLAVSQEAQK